jgi:hypothetical protein
MQVNPPRRAAFREDTSAATLAAMLLAVLVPAVLAALALGWRPLEMPPAQTALAWWQGLRGEQAAPAPAVLTAPTSWALPDGYFYGETASGTDGPGPRGYAVTDTDGVPFWSEYQRMGRLTILTAQMNPDLMMPELLKKTGAGNLFMVFGEPDIEIHHDGDEGIVSVEIRGVDVYDPTTGEIRSHSTDDIACWSIDTAYNEESFFVRHAYFLGAGDPYDRLKRALRADIDETAWASLYSARSRPYQAETTEASPQGETRFSHRLSSGQTI